jgi:hypothetical protein
MKLVICMLACIAANIVFIDMELVQRTFVGIAVMLAVSAILN